MPSVRKETTSAEGEVRVMTRVASVGMATVGTAGTAIPKQQQDAHVKHERA